MYGSGVLTGMVPMKKIKPMGPMTRKDPRGPKAGSYRMLRGGGWNNSPVVLRAAPRSYGDPGVRDYYVGFRLVRTPVSLGDEALPQLVTDPKLIEKLNNQVVEQIKEQAKQAGRC
jgi:hypothetical protein